MATLSGGEAGHRSSRIRGEGAEAFGASVRLIFDQETVVQQRFGLDTRNSARASRLLAEALKAGAIVPDDPAAASKLMRYLPVWSRAEDHTVI